ncbi:hypothetical protein AC579_4523 [Pseudocercospora musae]|uniref:Zn(2)-C6 fungal-type domain-containing protein n=1 Tax=Pseudocercospora musae TaxID=113226 RepID=A0A139HZJ3_9PEZI|nr:hypothetical protein AC579_4523 [Pseudocercospora musae]
MHAATQADSETAGSSKRQKSRHRASVACATCRERRIRCVVPPGGAECLQCTRAGTECIIKNDDERRRPISRAYMSALTDRVSLLESMLRDKGEALPPVVYPPKTTRGTLHADGDDSPVRPAPVQSHPAPKNDLAGPEEPSPRSVQDESYEGSHFGSSASTENRSERDGSAGTPIDTKTDGLVNRLLSTRGHLSFDQLSGRLRFYGGTVNCHIYSELALDESKSTRESAEQARRAEKIIRTLPIETHDYLMQLFWQHYNSVLHVVHEEAFNEDREHGRTQFYSGFLHVCILAMGYRFSDKTRPDMQRIALPDRESTLHREAKYMLDLELERPGGIPSIAALLILGDQEVGVGRDNAGWIFSGMAMRLCYDVGLQLDSRIAGLSQRETDIRRMTLWACVIYDRYWSLFLGRPLTMKSVDLEIYSLADQFERLGTCMPAGPGKSLHTRIYEALIELMEIAGKIVEYAEFRKSHDNVQGPDQAAYFKMATLDREIHNWASRLPPELRYTEENRTNAPLSFFLLHQQYHAILILLHRPFTRYDDPNSGDAEEINTLDSHFSKASRAICTKSAVAMARIFWQHRQRYDGKQIFCIGMQHAGAASQALIAALAYMPDATDRNNNMQYLEVLHAALQDMAYAYQPAERMAAVLNACMVELRGGPISPRNVAIPARRGSTTLEADRGSLKRRQMSRLNLANTAMPPPAPQRKHRASDAVSEGSHLSQKAPTIDPSSYLLVTPQSEAPPWPPMQPLDPQHRSLPETSTPAHANVGHDWMIPPDFSNHDFGPVPNLGDLPALSEGEIGNMEFLHGLPSAEDWSRWHAGSTADVSTDLDGFPPRGRQVPNNYHSPPMGGIMNG